MFNRIILFSVFSPSRDSILFESQEGEEPVTDQLRGAAITVLPPRPTGPEGRVEREGKTESRTLEKEESLSFTGEGWRKGSRESLHLTSHSLQPSFFPKGNCRYGR